MEQGGNMVKRTCKIDIRNVEVDVDNRWVIPYSPFLSRKFDCHLNVELCISRVGGIKYLFKYITKGRDRVTLEIVNEKVVYDEIKKYQDARYVIASEAFWRLMGYEYVQREPPVIRLDLHLDGQHTVYFQEGNEAAANARQRGLE